MGFIPNLNASVLSGTLAQIPTGTELAKLKVGTIYRATDGGPFMVSISGVTKSWLQMVSPSNSTHNVLAVSTSNIASLSGLAQTIDGVAINTAGMRVLLAKQTTTAQNGIWIAAAGAWTRPADWYTGNVATGGTQIEVASGTTWGPSTWRVTSSGSPIIDTNGITLFPRLVKGTQLLNGGGTATVSNLWILQNSSGYALVDQTAAAAVSGTITAGLLDAGSLALAGTAAHTIAYMIANW